MSRRVLLVTGARSLATRPGAEAWARALIAEALAGVDLLIVGDAPGPDRWAAWLAAPTDIEPHVYLTRGRDAGWVVSPDEEGECSFVRRWAPRGTSTHPLVRNTAMVAAAQSALAAGHTVTVLALLDGLKTDAPGRRATRGTEHTAGIAERAGLTVRREVWR